MSGRTSERAHLSRALHCADGADGTRRRHAGPHGPRAHRTAGLAPADLVILLALVSLMAALAYPMLRRSAFDSRVERAVSDVELLRRSAIAHRDRRGTWAPAAEPRHRPPELEGEALDSVFRRPDYGIEWRRWEVVELEEIAPPPEGPGPEEPGEAPLPIRVPVVRLVGGITVHTADEALLAELAARYGDTISFVYDTTWTLVLPQRTGASVSRSLPFNRD